MDFRLLNIIILMLGFTISGFAQNTPGPILLSPENNSNYNQTSKLQLSWLKIDSEESYKVHHSLDSNFAPSAIEENIANNRTNIIISDLQMNTTYFWRVKVDKDSSDWSEVWRFTTTGEPVTPNLVFPPNLANNQQQSLSLIWNSNPENTKYQLHFSASSNFSDTIKFVEQSDTLVDISGLKPNTLYYWRVKPFNIDGHSGSWAEKFEFKTVLATPRQIYPQNFTNNIDTVLSLRWSDVSTASIFNVQISTDELFEDETETISSNTLINKLEIDSLKTNTIYYWKILALNTFSDSSNWSDVYRFKTKLAPPKLVYPSDSTNNMNNDITLKWRSESDFDYYNIQVALDKYFNTILIEEELSTDSIAAVFENWTTYFWRVSGKNNLGDVSNWSKINQFKTKLIQPILVSPEDSSYFVTTSYNFSWENVFGADEYRFQLSEYQNYSTQLLDTTFSGFSFVVDSLSPNSTYYWRVMASNSDADTSVWSNSFSLNTTAIIVETDSIVTELNYSENPTDTIGTFQIHNYGDSEANISSIFIVPDSIYFIESTSVTISPNSTKSIIVFGDTSKIDTGFYFGTIKIIPDETLSPEDTIKIPISTYAIKSVGFIRVDSLNYDTVFVDSKMRESFIFSNADGNYPLQITDYLLVGTDTTAFNIINMPQIISPRDSSTITIEYSPAILDSNKAELFLETNSYPNKHFVITLTGVGKGGRFAETTINSLVQLSDTTFETFTNNNIEVIFINNGNSQITFNTSFTENYFRKIEKISTTKLNAGDSTTITLQYITPNFDTLNIDTLKINHNGIGDSPISIPLSGTFDSLNTSKIIIDKLYVNDKLFTNEDYLFEEKKSISFSLLKNTFEDKENLVFKINYYQGGPSEKQTAIKGGTNKFVIPYQNVTNSGLLFKGELFTKTPINSEVDSVTIFDFKNAQIVFDNYTTPIINVPKSTAGNRAEDAAPKWVLFGFPFADVVSDSIFALFGGINNMEDGEWIVYNYENDLTGFKMFNEYSFNSNSGYFIAQSMQKDFAISYNYKNQTLSKKLTEKIITLQNPGEWNTISNPFTFPVEVDTPAVLYKYDVNNLRYRLTNIMRTGEAYFVEPTITELKLKTYGEYYPDLFPKIAKYINWSVSLLFVGEKGSDEVVVSMLNKEKTKHSKINYLNPPSITNTIDAYIMLDNDLNRYHSNFISTSEGAVWNVHLSNLGTDDQITISTIISGEFPKHFSTLLLDEENMKREILNLTKGGNRIFKLIVGTDRFIKETTNNLNSQLPTEFSLSQNYPNPFGEAIPMGNPSTTIRYEIPVETRHPATAGSVQTPLLGGVGGGLVTLKVYDILGREVATLVNQNQKAGNYEVKFSNKSGGLTSGIYFYRLSSGSYNKTMKMILLK
ncbi:MAG: T9SS type A sorting domain-containing protein [Melioribacteraceae bacterium]|nr:T9SS type A sorting domain-containing protein [Melioribacteraceae bacterium]